MGYLYADSEPFPYDYDFLATFRGFLVASARCMELLEHCERLEEQIGERTRAAEHAARVLDQLGNTLESSADMAAARAGDAEVTGEVVRRIHELVERATEEAKASRLAEAQRFEGEARTRIAEHREEMRRALEAFFLECHVELVDSRFRLKLHEGGYRMTAICRLPRDVEVSYRLASESLDEWSEPRRVADFAGEMQLQVGMKKKWLKRDLTREIVRVDDHVVTAAHLEGDRAEIHLRKKVDAPADDLVLVISRNEGSLATSISRPSDERDETPFPAVSDDLEKIERLLGALEQAAVQTLGHKRSVESIRIDGSDAVEGSRVVGLVESYVDLFAPIVAEIARRSAGNRELTLKL